MQTQVTETSADGEVKTFMADAPNNYKIDPRDIPVAIYVARAFEQRSRDIHLSDRSADEKRDALNALMKECHAEGVAWGERNEDLLTQAEDAGLKGDDLVDAVIAEERRRNAAEKSESQAPAIGIDTGEEPAAATAPSEGHRPSYARIRVLAYCLRTQPLSALDDLSQEEIDALAVIIGPDCSLVGKHTFELLSSEGIDRL